MARHTYTFESGEELTTMGAGWFVSFCYYEYIDKAHKNWDRISTVSSRNSVYRRTGTMHQYWLRQILSMNDNNLNKNTIGLSAKEIKVMAKAILDYWHETSFVE